MPDPILSQHIVRAVRGGAVAFGFFFAAPMAASSSPSPTDWRDLVIYQVITDRFFDGDPANNAVEGNFAPADGARIHGGDFAGIQHKLDYLVHLGVDAIWISPVTLNTDAQYHGYAAHDLFSLAPHFGTLSDLRSLVEAAHARGLFVVLDVVTNHMGTLIDSAEPGYPAFRYPGTYSLRWRNGSRRYFGVLDDLARFHAHGHIGNFTDPEQVVGELFGLDDLKTEDPAVRAELVRAAEWLIDSTGCDGFRIDTVKHVEMGFWNLWAPAVRAHAASVGKNAFFLFGEVFDGIDAKCGSYTGTQSGGNYKLDSVLHFPMYFTVNGVFLWDDPPRVISDRYAQLDAYDPTSRERLVTFLDNHDRSRFLRAGPGPTVQDESRLRTALGWLLTSRGVPVVYYGTEQEFDGGGDPFNREDMWDGAWDFGPSDGDNFDLAHPLFRYVRRLTEVRRRHEALRRGMTLERYFEPTGPGLYLYERRGTADTVVVAVNTSNAPITRGAESTPWPAGTVLVDALEPQIRDTTGAGGAMTLSVPARGVRVIESLAARHATATRERLAVEAIFPGHDQSLNDLHSPLTLTFDREVDERSLAAGFAITPSTAGVWQAEGAIARFHPAAPWSPGVTYRWSLDSTVSSFDGRRLAARFDAFFETFAYATEITVPAGYGVDRIARQGLSAPEGLVHAPGISPTSVLLSDTGRDRLFTLTPGGDLGHFLGDSRWTKPEGLAVPGGPSIAVVDESGIYHVDSRRLTAVLAGSSSASVTGAAAYGSGSFGDGIYLCDPAGDRIVRLESGSLVPFVAGIRGGEGLAFGPGGVWGTDLYVADADHTSLGTPADGPGRIVRVASDGTVGTVAESSLLRGASALVFDPGVRFGGDLFVADILSERIIRITPAGGVSVFASGFNNLSGSHCLAFGPDAALYVADPGSGQPFSNSSGSKPPQVLRIAPQALVKDVSSRPGASIRLAPPVPNPSRGAVTLSLFLSSPAQIRLSLYDLAGRLVRMLVSTSVEAGESRVHWDGRDTEGRRVGAGIYFARLDGLGRTVSRHFVILD